MSVTFFRDRCRCGFVTRRYIPIRSEVRKISTAVRGSRNSDVGEEGLNNDGEVVSVVVLGFIADGVQTKTHILSSTAGLRDLRSTTNGALAQPGVQEIAPSAVDGSQFTVLAKCQSTFLPKTLRTRTNSVNLCNVTTV